MKDLPSPASFGLPYVPVSYVPREQERSLIWHHPTEPIELLEPIGRTCDRACESSGELLGFVPHRRLHLCLFHTEGAFQVALERPLTASWFLAPFHSETDSLIVCTSPSAYPKNGDPRRMLRVLAHEIVHCFNHEASRSTKILGDGNRDRHIPSWLDEGLAEVVAARVTARPELIDCHLQRGQAPEQSWNDDRLNQALDTLDSQERGTAFALAVRRVLELAKEHESLAAFYGRLRRQGLFTRGVLSPRMYRNSTVEELGDSLRP
jgi:hypothetical protein